MNRCNATVIDNNTRRNRRCMKSFKFEINGCKCCHIHANKNFGIYVCKIQAVYRSYLCRNKVKKIKEMPVDIQQIITGYMRDDFVNSRYNCQLSNFLVKKIRKYLYYLSNTNLYYSSRTFNRELNNVKKLYDFIKLKILIEKYEIILNYNNDYTKSLYYYDNYFTRINYSLKDLIKNISNIAICKIDDLQKGKLTIINGILFESIN